MAPKIDDWLDDVISINSDAALADTPASSNTPLACPTLAPSPPPTTCTFEVLICAHFTCTSPTRDVVKSHDCGCSSHAWCAQLCTTRWCAARDGRADILPTDGDRLQFGQKPPAPHCFHQGCRRWQCAARGGKAETLPVSGGSRSLQKSSARLWGRPGCDRCLHFCGEHARPSAVLDAMRKRQGQPLACRLWSGPFPGEYLAHPGFGEQWVEWVDMWDAMVREWESASTEAGPADRVNGLQVGPC